jgi:hypothetical protein
MTVGSRLAVLLAAIVLAGHVGGAAAQNAGGVAASVPGIVQVPQEGVTPSANAFRIRPAQPTPQNGPPLYGRAQPLVGPPSPLPQSARGGANPCPNGYVEAPGNRLPHTTICVVGQQLANIRASNVQTQNLQTQYLGPTGKTLTSSSLPPTLEAAGVNRCAARPGYYACGRGGSECCGPYQDNLCFPGAYACSLQGLTASGPRQACCMIR